MKILIVFFILLSIQSTVKAGGNDDFLASAKGFLDLGKAEESKNPAINQGGLVEISNFLLGILIPVGIVTSVIVTGILGIQFMFGSTENKAEVKEALMPWGISIVVLFSAYTIWKVVVNVLASLD